MSPRAVELHGRLQDDELGRGEQRHLRSTRFFKDPRTGEPWPGKEERVRSMGRLEQHVVTEQMVAEEPYGKLLARSEIAIYPGAAPRRLYELEMAALRAGNRAACAVADRVRAQLLHPDGRLSRGRRAFHSTSRSTSIASWRCACAATAPGWWWSRTRSRCHLTHREGYRDPMKGEDGWEQAFARRHPFETGIDDALLAQPRRGSGPASRRAAADTGERGTAAAAGPRRQSGLSPIHAPAASSGSSPRATWMSAIRCCGRRSVACCSGMASTRCCGHGIRMPSRESAMRPARAWT